MIVKVKKQIEESFNILNKYDAMPIHISRYTKVSIDTENDIVLENDKNIFYVSSKDFKKYVQQGIIEILK